MTSVDALIMRAQMLIRRPPSDVFAAFVDPNQTTRFWFTKSSGKLAPGASVTWEWEMYGVSAPVTVTEFDEGRRLVIEWDDPPTTVEWRFEPYRDEGTLLQITHSGFSGSDAEIAAQVIDSKGGFSFLLAGAKAFLEHGIELNLVADHAPPP